MHEFYLLTLSLPRLSVSFINIPSASRWNTTHSLKHFTGTSIRFEFWRLGYRNAGTLSGSVSLHSSNISTPSLLSSPTRQVAIIETTTPQLNQSGRDLTILESGTNVTGLTLRGRGFEASPFEDSNLINIFDLENALYSNGGTSAGASPIYEHVITKSTRTTLTIRFPTLYRNSTRIDPLLSPFSAEVSVDGGTTYIAESYQDEGTDSSDRGYSFRARLYRACLNTSTNLCSNNATCYDIVEAPITGLDYVCECQSYSFGGDHCEYTLTENEEKCSRLCLHDMQPCRNAYELASTGYNDEQTQGFSVSLKTYVEKYLSFSSETYIRTSDSDINALWLCWQVTNRSVSSSALFSSLGRSEIYDGSTIPLLSLFTVTDLSYFAYFGIAFFVLLFSLCLVRSPIVSLELI